MAGTLAVPTPEQERDELRVLVRALVNKAGGEVELGISDMLTPPNYKLLREERSGGAGRIVFRLVDPNAPVEGGAYFVKVPGKYVAGREWIAATYSREKWWIVGEPMPVTPTEVSDRIFHPGEMG